MMFLPAAPSLILAGLLAAPLAMALPQMRADSSTLGYDNVYDNASGELGTVACSDGSNGLITKGYTTFGSLPNFPNVGGIPAITDWNSPSCGSCWQISYNGTSIYFTGIDVGKDSFVASEAAMNTLTNGNAGQLGRVDVTAAEVAASHCGF